MAFRELGKRAVEKALRVGLAGRGRMAGRSLILAYHNVVPDSEAGRGDRSLHLPWSTFLRQLDLIQTAGDVRPLTTLLAGHLAEDRPTIAITFDDAYRGAVTLALPELDRRGLPAMLFVAPGLLGAENFWWDELAASTGLETQLRRAALDRHAGRAAAIRGSLGPAVPARLPHWYRGASAGEIHELAAHPRLYLGAHTWSHPNCTRISEADLREELTQPLAWLRRGSVASMPVLAYPYGLGSPTVEAAAAAAGYTHALRIDGGWLPRRGVSPWRIPRYNVPAGLSADGFALRLAGVLLR